MCFGGTALDRFSINDDTAWSGSPARQFAGGAVSSATAREALRAARAAVLSGDYAAADAAVRRLQQRYTQAYLPYATLEIAIHATGASGPLSGSTSRYRRSLDLHRAVHRVSWEEDGRQVDREAFVSVPHDVMVVITRLGVSREFDLVARFDTQLRVIARHLLGETMLWELQLPSDVAPNHEDVDEPVTYSDRPDDSLRGVIAARWVHDGFGTESPAELRATAPSEAVLYLATATTFNAIGVAPGAELDGALARAIESLERAIAMSPATLIAEHVRDHRRLYDRVELRLAGRRKRGTTTARLARAFADRRHPLAADPSLAALLFHYGRYLLISSSRPGTLPATLQGIWNDQIPPPWSCNYTLNVNTEMNYWPAESANLAECHEPLFALAEALVRPGAEMASRLYGARGWAAHHNSDAWAFTSPVGMGTGNPAWAFWPMAGLWLVRHFWEHVDHGASDEFAERAWPIVRGAVEFALDWAVCQPDGTFATLLSTSPENEFDLPAGGTAAVARTSTMDVELLRDSFTIMGRLARRLGREDDPVAGAAAQALTRVTHLPIAGDGTICDWFDDLVAHDPHHRHLSPLYGLYPGDHCLDGRELEAASATLDARGDESSGWSLAWKICLRARLGQPEKVADLLALVFRDATTTRGPWTGGLYTNLFAAHPPFQIDCNLGYVAGIVECLVQSHSGKITLLPALPDLLGTGSVRGLVVRPGVDVDLSWREGSLVAASLTSRRPLSLCVRYRGVERYLDTRPGRAVALDPADFSSPDS
jgi:alpha-L-fucosidase 2